MRLASVREGERAFLGLGIDERIVDLGEVLGAQAPADMIGLIQAFDLLKGPIAQAAAEMRANAFAFRSYAPDQLSWRAPVPNPSKICCLALNNSANAERILKGPSHPATFIKPSSALAGHGEPIQCRPEYGRVHPEPELAFIVGRTAKAVSAADAMSHLFGYTIHNDITSPTMRGEDTFHYRAIHPKAGAEREVEYVETWVSYPGRYKCADSFSCMGPWLVTADEIADPHDLVVRCSHRGETITEDNTANLFFKIPETIEFISRYMTLLPGDVISMGTALKQSAGGAAVQNIDLNRLGGPISVSIQGLGELTNPVAHSG